MGTLSAPAAAAPVPPTPAPSAEERRLVTALFCDLVGFTPLSEQLDPEEVRDIQAQYFSAMSQQIERYAGMVEKYAGDAVLALFGVPMAHEDDAERAVLCALGMQAAIESVADQARRRWSVEPSIRVGVNTGEVVSGTWSASGRQDMAVTGDAINTAARLQGAADSAEVLVGSETMHLTRRRIRYGPRRDLSVKGKVGTVPAYAALGVREQLGERWEEAPRVSPLVGRDRELVQLLDAWIRAQGGDGQLLTLVGEPGVGKSRLIAETVEKISLGSAVRIVRARCLSYGQEISLWLLADFLRSLFGIQEREGSDEIRVKLEVAIRSLLTASDSASQAEAIDVLGEVLGLPPGDSLVAQAGPQIRRQALLRGMRLLLGALAERSSTVLVIEDLHWIDQASEEVFKEILSDVPGLRILVLAAQRPGWNAPWSEWGWTERMTLRPLREADATVLAGAVLGGMRLSPELERYVAERAGGNPFFVEEILRALEERGGLEQHEGVMRLVRGAAERLPSSLTEVLLARLDRLESQVKNVAQVGSVIGRTFAVQLLAGVMERELVALEMPLAALQQAEIAFPRRTPDLEYVFKHVSMREVAYNTLVARRRQELHLATARSIAALYPSDEYVEMIAYHYSKTEEHAEAAEWLERAGDRAAGVYANEGAIANYEEAIKRLVLVRAEDTARARVYEKLGAVLHTSSRFDEALQVLEQAVEIYQQARDLEAVGRVTATIGRVHRDRGTVEEGVARLRPMLDLLAWSGPSPARAHLYVALAHLYFAGGLYEDSIEAAEHGAEIARAIGDNALLAAAEMRRGSSLGVLGRMHEGVTVLESSARLAEAAGDLNILSIAVNNLGEAHFDLGDLERGRSNIERAFQLAERVGELASMGYSLARIGGILYVTGEWAEAEDCILRGAEAIRLVGSSWYAAYPPLELGRLKLAQGAWGEAARSLHECVSIAGPIGDIQALQGAHRYLAELDMLEGRVRAAIDRLEPLANTDPLPDQIGLLAILAWAQLEEGLTAQARDTVTRALEMTDAGLHRPLLPEALRVLGMIHSEEGRWDKALSAFQDAVSVAQSLPFPYGEARALCEWAHTQLERHERTDAHGRLNEALAIFRQLGAEKDIARTEQMLQE